jgi:hypothetical protein
LVAIGNHRRKRFLAGIANGNAERAVELGRSIQGNAFQPVVVNHVAIGFHVGVAVADLGSQGVPLSIRLGFI